MDEVPSSAHSSQSLWKPRIQYRDADYFGQQPKAAFSERRPIRCSEAQRVCCTSILLACSRPLPVSTHTRHGENPVKPGSETGLSSGPQPSILPRAAPESSRRPPTFPHWNWRSKTGRRPATLLALPETVTAGGGDRPRTARGLPTHGESRGAESSLRTPSPNARAASRMPTRGQPCRRGRGAFIAAAEVRGTHR